MFRRFLARITRADSAVEKWLEKVRIDLYALVIENNDIVDITYEYVNDVVRFSIVYIVPRLGMLTTELVIPFDALVKESFPATKLYRMFVTRKAV